MILIKEIPEKVKDLDKCNNELEAALFYLKYFENKLKIPVIGL